MDLEELFEDNDEIVDLEGVPVFVDPLGAPKIMFWGDIEPGLGNFCKQAPKDADAFVRGEEKTVRKRRENSDASMFWPPLAPIYDILHYQAVQYFKKY